MSTSPNRALLKSVLLLAILLPLVSLSQVRIKEKVEIKPSPAAQARMLSSTHDFFSPPLFAPGSTNLALPSMLTITGSVSFSGQIHNNQSAHVVYVKYRIGNFEQDQEVFWKGRASDGSYYEGQNPFTGPFGIGGPFPGPYSSIELFTYDGYGGWGTSTGEVATYDDTLLYSFTDYLPPVTVNATATVTGSSLPTARFNRWRINCSSQLSCGQSTALNISPLDSSGSYYAPNVGSGILSGSFTVSLQAKGDYAFLRYGDQEGRQITISVPQQDQCYLVLDTDRGNIPNERDTAIVTVTGGGKTKSIPIELVCEKFDHLTIISSSPNVLVGSSVKLTVIAMDINEQEVTLPEDFDVTLEIYPYDYFAGSFSVNDGAPVRETLTLPYSVARAGRIRYLANDVLPDDQDCTGVEIDVWRTSDEEKWGYTEEMIAKPVCATVTFTPSTLAPGDTATLTLQAGSGDSMFDVSIFGDDGKSGTLVSSGGSGTALQGVLGPFQYIAPATIDGSSKTIQVAAVSYGSCGGGTPMRMERSTNQTKAPGNATAQSLRKRLPLSKTHGLSLLKKTPSQTKIQSLNKKEQQLVTAAIGRMIALATCPPPTSVVVEQNNDCPSDNPLNAIRTVTDDVFSVAGPNNDDGRCDEPDHPVGVAWAEAQWMVSSPVARKEQILIPTPYVSFLHITLKWGYCKKNLRNIYGDVKFVDTTLESIRQMIPVFEAKKAIADFQKSTPDPEIGFTGNISYYPLLKTEAHELLHTEQYKSRLKEEYGRALFEINNYGPPLSGWCHGSPLDQRLYVRDQEDKAKNGLKRAAKAVDDRVKREKPALETDAYAAGHEAVVGKMVLLVKQAFGLQ
jgi:hypothetical protein